MKPGLGRFVGFIDNFVDESTEDDYVEVNHPIYIGKEIIEMIYDPLTNTQIAHCEDSSYYRSLNYAESSPYGWKKIDCPF